MSDTAQQVKEKLDIVEILRGYLKVTPAGKNFKAICPFHKEKTPSLMISPEKQSWYCFGCNQGGDLIKFVMQFENLEFYDALKILADKAGIDIRTSGTRDFRAHNNLYTLLTAAKDFFVKSLATDTETDAYIRSRGLKKETQEEFEIGVASTASDGLLKALVKAGFAMPDIERAGLVIKTDRGTYWDRFRARVMFPIYNHVGKVVGFTGRVLPGHENPNMGKYVNSPETPIFQKSKIIYGYHKTKNHIREANTAVLVEGQMDFLMAWQDGVKNVVATSGTALTKDHLSVLRRISDTLVVGYDGDTAGIAAAERAVDLASTLDFNTRVMLIEGVKDPADIVMAEPGKLSQLIKQSLPSMEYYFYKYLTSLKDHDIAQKKKGIRAVLSKIAVIDSAVERSHWIQELSSIVGVEGTALNEELSKIKGSTPIAAERAQVQAAVAASRRDLISQRILGIAMNFSSTIDLIKDAGRYFSPLFQPIYEAVSMGKNIDDQDIGDTALLVGLRSGMEIRTTDEVLIFAEMTELLRQLKLEYFKEKRQALAETVRNAELQGDESATQAALREFDLVTKEMQNT